MTHMQNLPLADKIINMSDTLQVEKCLPDDGWGYILNHRNMN